MSRSTRALALALTVSCVAVLALAASAQALPAKFWGVVPQAQPSVDQVQTLADGGVESMRIPVEWGALQHNKGEAINWGGVDAIVEKASRAGIDILPTMSGVPVWAVPSIAVPGGGGSKAPARLPISGPAASAWKSLLTQAVERYGPGGDFWALHPDLPVRPIRTWQIYNEPNFKYFVARPNPTEYGKLVKISHSAIKLADPGAQILLAGLFAKPKGARKNGKHTSPNWYASDFLTRMYKTNPGIRSRFNGVALHPYSINASEIPASVEELRRVLSANGDGAKGLWVTELGWSSQNPVGRSNLFAKGIAGQARELTTSLNTLRAKQVKWKIKRVYWFSVDDAKGVCNFCDGSGLFGDGFIPKKSWYSFVKFTGGTP